MTIEFLHPDATVSVEWLCDSYVNRIKPVQLQIESAINTLYLIPSVELTEVTLWMVSSVEHFLWVAQYYEALCTKYERVVSREFRGWQLRIHINKVVPYFPQNGWKEPPLYNIPADCVVGSVWESYRLCYKRTKYPKYRKVRRPFWL